MSVNLVASLIKQVLPKLIESAGAWAAETEAVWDDFAVSVLRFLYDSEEFRLWMAQLIAGTPAGALAIVAPSEALRLSAERRGIDWAKFLEALPLIITLVRAAIGK